MSLSRRWPGSTVSKGQRAARAIPAGSPRESAPCLSAAVLLHYASSSAVEVNRYSRPARIGGLWNDRDMRLILRLLANAAALAVATFILSGITLTAKTTGSKVLALLIVALIFGVLNAIVKPIFALVTAPLLLLTLGLFLIVINACMLLLTSWIAGKVGLGWHVSGFWTAVIGAIIVSIVSFLLNAFLPDKNERGRV
jgi:putative membrane protein